MDIVINHFIEIGQTMKTARKIIPGIKGANDIIIYCPLLSAAEDAAMLSTVLEILLYTLLPPLDSL